MKIKLAAIVLGFAVLAPQAHALPNDPQPVYGLGDSIVRTAQAIGDYGLQGIKALYTYGWATINSVGW